MPELKKCPLCGDTVEFEIDFPTFDGTGKTVKRIVPKRCACSLKKEEELKRQMELYSRKREVERLRSLSLIPRCTMLSCLTCSMLSRWSSGASCAATTIRSSMM